MDIVSAIVGRIAACLLHAALRQLGYLLHYNHNIKTLEEQTQLLACRRERVQGKIETAERNGEIIRTDVQKWIQDVDEKIAEAQKFLDDEAKANKSCLRGWCINVWSVYRFSKQALSKAKVISKFLECGRFEIVVVPSQPAPSPENVSLSEGFSGERNGEKRESNDRVVEPNH